MQEKGGALFYDTKESLQKEKDNLNSKIAVLQSKIKIIDSKLSTYTAKTEQAVANATANAEKPWYKRWLGVGGKKTVKRRRSSKK